MERLLQDLGYAWRHLRRSPGFALAAILTLALGIGANTAMFSMLNALTLRKLPVERPDELVAIAPRTSRGLPRSTPISAVAELQRDGPLQHLCGYLGAVFLPVLINNSPVQTMTTFVTGQCFAALSVTPIIGRAIEDADAPIYSPGARVAVVSHRLWTHALGSNPAVLGTSIQVNNVDATIIGVLPRGFVGLDVDHGVDVFTPFDAVIAAGPTRRQLASFLLGRLRPRVTLEEASAELQTRWPALLDAILPATLAPSERTQLLDSTPHLERMATGTSRNRERYMRPLTLTLGITALLLFLACINLGGLLLARLAARSGELAVRLALGGSRWRIGQQMLIESLVLSLSGAALGVPLAYAIVVALASFIPPQTVPYTMSFTPDARALAVTSALGVAVGIGMTALPIWMATRRAAGMQAIWERTIAGSTSRLGRAFLVAQVSLSVVSLTGAALLTRSLHLLQNADLGIRTGNILNVKLSMRPNAPYNRGDRESYYPPLLDEIAALPSVRAVSIAHNFPRVTTTPTGMPVMATADQPSGIGASIDDVSPGFFATMGIPLLAGRDVSWADTLQTRRVGVISESLARALSPHGDVLERSIRIRTLPVDLEMVIVGVVGDATQGNPRELRPRLIYRPALQVPQSNAFDPNLLIDTTDAATVAAGIREILRKGGRDYAQEIIGLEALLARAPASERMSATVAAAVGALAVLLALIGVYAGLTYGVSRRRREIGVRMAVGATPAVVARGVVREGVLVAAAGVALGLPFALLSARALRSLMYGISEMDVATYIGVTIFFLALGATAGLLPARQAARVDPMIALRAE